MHMYSNIHIQYTLDNNNNKTNYFIPYTSAQSSKHRYMQSTFLVMEARKNFCTKCVRNVDSRLYRRQFSIEFHLQRTFVANTIALAVATSVFMPYKLLHVLMVPKYDIQIEKKTHYMLVVLILE